MFCPVCQCEFREGFTRCEGCNADLVEELAPAETSTSRPEAPLPAASVPVADYCGFLDLEEARQAREALRRESIASDILIRESPETPAGGPVREEYWLRVESAKLRVAGAILGFDQAEEVDVSAESSTCGKCGYQFASAEPFCPGCGTRNEPE